MIRILFPLHWTGPIRTGLLAGLVIVSLLVAPVRADVTVDPATEQVIDGALRYLATQQLPNGAWGTQHQAAITAYAIMAYITAGHLPGEGPYGQQLDNGLRFLLDCVRPDGYIAAPTGASNMYGHGIATIVLGELYGQTNNEEIRPRLQRAIDCILASQNNQGGWRYNPRPADADMSVSVLQVVALRVAINAGLDVPQEAIDRAVAYVKSCQHAPSGGFTYMPRRNDPGFARTAAAVYSLQVCGLYDDPMVAQGIKYLSENTRDRGWFTYGHFYAAPAHYMIGGETWEKWYREIHETLMTRVRRSGNLAHWTHIDGRQDGGEVYATAAYTMILAMPYNYLPLYQR